MQEMKVLHSQKDILSRLQTLMMNGKKIRLNIQLAHFKQIPHNLVYYDGMQPFNQKNIILSSLGLFLILCLYRCMISPSGVMFRRHFFDFFQGFDTKLRVCEDYDLWLK